MHESEDNHIITRAKSDMYLCLCVVEYIDGFHCEQRVEETKFRAVRVFSVDERRSMCENDRVRDG